MSDSDSNPADDIAQEEIVDDIDGVPIALTQVHTQNKLFIRKCQENVKANHRLFHACDVAQSGVLTVADIKVLMKSMSMYPPVEEIRKLIAAVDTKRKGTIDFDDFMAMRSNHDAPADLNVIFEFKRFDVSAIHRGHISKECILQVMSDEGFDEVSIEMYMKYLMSADSNSDGKIGIRDLYVLMMRYVPQQWLDWVYENIAQNAPEGDVVAVLVENGFTEETAHELIQQTKQLGLLRVPTFADSLMSYCPSVSS
eukprot:GFYU01012195.1.p1 GENE.GFYU01012195.1~~GFYU01012195.1.p1  ORF type:complete len:254 (+),score=43.46 GFYU01012195.1:89-850(+)